jgi:hypothetical protein
MVRIHLPPAASLVRTRFFYVPALDAGGHHLIPRVGPKARPRNISTGNLGALAYVQRRPVILPPFRGPPAICPGLRSRCAAPSPSTGWRKASRRALRCGQPAYAGKWRRRSIEKSEAIKVHFGPCDSFSCRCKLHSTPAQTSIGGTSPQVFAPSVTGETRRQREHGFPAPTLASARRFPATSAEGTPAAASTAL